MDIALYYIVIGGAWIGSIGYLVKGMKALKGGRDGIFAARPTAIRTVAIGAFGLVFWLLVIIISIYNQITAN